MRKKERHDDIIVSDGIERHRGLRGRVVHSEYRGVSAILENGERVSLKNRQFDYLSEINSQNQNNGVK